MGKTLKSRPLRYDWNHGTQKFEIWSCSYICIRTKTPMTIYMLQQESHNRLETSGKMPARNPANKTTLHNYHLGIEDLPIKAIGQR